MKRFIALTISGMMLLALVACTSKTNKTPSKKNGMDFSTPEPVVSEGTVRPEYSPKIEFIEPLEEPEESYGSLIEAQTFEKLLSVCKYAVYGEVEAVREVTYTVGENEKSYVTVVDFAAEKSFPHEFTKGQGSSITFFLFDSSYGHNADIHTFIKGEKCMVLLNDSTVDSAVSTLNELAPYRIPLQRQCIIEMKDGSFDVTLLNTLLSASGKKEIELPCTDVENIFDLLSDNADGLLGLTINSLLM